MRFDKDQAVRVGKRLKDKVSENDITGKAAEMAYRFFLAIFPFFIFLAALGGFVGSAFNVQNPTDEVMNLLGDSLPEDSSSVLRTQLEGVINSQNGGLLTIGILATIWASSSAIGALMKNFNQIFEVEEDRSMPARYGIALGLTLLSAGFIVTAFVVFFFGQIYGPDLAAEIGLQNTAADAISLARWPAALVLLIVAMAFLYWMAPNTKLAMRWISPGAVFFGLAWLIATFAFGLYVANFSSYNATYGALGGVVILLIWFYLTSFILLLGAAINAVLAEEVGGEDLSADGESASGDRLQAPSVTPAEAQESPPSKPPVQREFQPARPAAAMGLEAARRQADDSERWASEREDGGPASQPAQTPEGVGASRVSLGLAGVVGLVALVRALRSERA